MDEQAFRETLGDVRDRPCVFQRGILQKRCACQHSRRVFLAEREIVACASIEGFKTCEAFMHILKHKAAFVLRLEDPQAPMPYAKAIKLQVGAISALSAIVTKDQALESADIYSLLQRSQEQFKGMEAIPYERLFDSIRQTKRRSSE